VPAADAYVREGDTVRVGELAANVWEAPGHCADDVACWFAADRALFAGDTIFTLGCGRVMESTHAQMWNSLTRLAALPDPARSRWKEPSRWQCSRRCANGRTVLKVVLACE
jgi:hydroxyacylglutathione hydrolase